MGEVPSSLLDAAALVVGTTSPMLRSSRGAQPLAMKRQIVMYLLHNRGYSEPAIARALNRDHSTVNYAWHKIEDRMKNAPAFDLQIAQYRATLLQVFSPYPSAADHVEIDPRDGTVWIGAAA